MAVSREEVLHIASLARFKLDENRVDALARELTSILKHIEVLRAVDTSSVSSADVVGSGGTPLRPDGGPPDTLSTPLQSFAPDMKDGFFMVPRLATHEDSPESGA
jgi:aspartyl-tRNA(Asn)/glutamyl-tRNA(Gln) amidotransferase subunit C